MSSPASGPAKAQTIVLIHGMWMTPLSWEHWIEHYTDRGYRVIAPAWPGLDREPEDLRRDPSPLRVLGIREIVDHYDRIIRGLDGPAIIIGPPSAGCTCSCSSIAGSAQPASRSARRRQKVS